ncbi:hypothetical protein Bbelb_234550 [Branchiostoma belcheri]|nr:hypothetical protein Bbelb_234550 [Branchiostoma belcheri]
MHALFPIYRSAESDRKDRQMQYVDKPPDGGWGWVVVLSTFLSHIVLAAHKSLGVFYVEFREVFQESAGNTSFITPIASALSNLTSCRAVVMAGSVICAVGLGLSFFAKNIVHLIITIGLVTGFGMSLMYIPGLAMIGKYFDKRHATANGIAISGTGVSMFILSPVFQFLIDEYRWNGALLIFAAITLNGCVCGALLRPLHLKDSDIVQETEPKEEEETSTYAGLVTCMVFYGISAGMFQPLLAVLIRKYSGVSRISGGLGWAFVFQGAAFLLGQPIAGWLYDATGNYDMSFYAAATFIFVSVVVLLLLVPKKGKSWGLESGKPAPDVPHDECDGVVGLQVKQLPDHDTVTTGQNNPAFQRDAESQVQWNHVTFASRSEVWQGQLSHNNNTEQNTSVTNALDVRCLLLALYETEQARTSQQGQGSQTSVYSKESGRWKDKQMKYVDKPPDGGWGWVVVLSTFLVHVIALGSVKSLGVFYAEFREVFHESAGNTSFISSVFVAIVLMCSPIASALSNLTSCRAVVMAGGVISAVGLGLSFFAQNIVHLIITIGLVTGFGMSLMYSPSLAMIGKYFDKRHATANGIAISGTGVSMFALSPLFQFLIDEFGWNGALLIFAGMALNGCVSGALLRPLYLKDAGNETEPEDEETTANSSQMCKSVIPFCQKVLEMFDVTLLKSNHFLTYSVSLFLLMLGNSMIFVHIVAHAQALGVDKTQAAFLPSVMGIAEAIVRPISGWLSDRLPVRKLHYYMVGCIGLGICNIAIPHSSTYVGLVACMVFYGISSGTFYPLIAVLVRKYSGVSRISGGLGWAFVFQGAAFLLGQPIAGWLYDATGNYDMSFYAAATFIFVSVVVLLLLVPKKGKSWGLESGKPAPDVPHDECDGVVGLQLYRKYRQMQYVDKPPDGGWGWVVVLSMFLSDLTFLGSWASMGVFYAEFREVFHESAGNTSFISSVTVSFLLMCSPIASALSNLTSCRAVVMAGSVISALGLGLSIFAKNIVHLVITIGMVTGFGMSLMYSPSLAMIGKYFDKRHATANGIAISGTGVSMFILSPLFQFLIDEFRWNGALLIYAGMALNGCVFGALLRPLHLKDAGKVEETEPEEDETSADSSQTCKSVVPFCQKVLEMFDVTLLKSRPFLTYSVSLFVLMLGNSMIYVHLVAHAQALGIEKTKASFLTSVMGIVEAISRAINGWLSDRLPVRKLYYFMVGCIGLGICTIAIPNSKTYTGLVACMVFYGISSGTFYPLIVVLVRKYSGVSRISGGLGWAFVFKGTGFLLGQPIAGWLYDATGNYDMSFYAAATFIFVSVVVLLLLVPKKGKSWGLESGKPAPDVPHDECDGVVGLQPFKLATGQFNRSLRWKTPQWLSDTLYIIGGWHTEPARTSQQGQGSQTSVYVYSKESGCWKYRQMQYVDKPPDGGWGWVVVLSTFLVHVIALGSVKSLGVFYAEFREVFHETAGNTSFISSVFVAIVLMCSPIASALSNLTSCRAVVMAGGVISAVGLGISFFAQNIVHLIITIGLVTGLMSLMYSPSLAMIGKYFDKRHATANGIAISGTGVSMFALSPLFQFLIDEFGWNGALLIFAGMALNGCVSGALLRPLYLKDAGNETEPEDEETTVDSSQTCKSVIPFCQKFLEMFDVTLLKSKHFLTYSVSLFLLMLGNSMIFVHIVAHAQALGVDKTQAAFLPSVMGIAEAIVRPISGWLSDRLPVRKLHYYMVGCIGLGICNIAIPHSSTYVGLVACMVFYGISSGTFYPLIAVLIRKYSGVSRISGGLGWAFVFQGAAFLLGQPIAGWLYDATGNYDMSFYAAATFIFVSVVVLLLLVPKKGKSWGLESGKPAPDVPHDECDGVVGLQSYRKYRQMQYVDKPPDGGWGWVVVLSMFLSDLTFLGSWASMGVFYAEFREVFHESAGNTSFISSVTVSFLLMCSPIASALSNLTSCRAVVMVGSVISALGLGISIFAKKHRFGMSLMYSPSLAMIGKYFDKRHATANGIAISGTGVSMFILSPLFQFLIDEFRWNGALLIYAGMALNGCVFGALLRPLHLKDVAHAQALGVEKTQAAFLPSVMGIVEAISRAINGWLSDRLPVRKLYYFMVGCIGLGICTIAIPNSKTYTGLVACMVFYGISSGTFYPLIVVLVRKYSGVSRISGGLGWAFVFKGTGFLLGQPIAGWLYDATGNYDMSFYAAATFIFVSVVILLLLVPKKGKSWGLESGKPAPDVPHDECDGVVGLQVKQLPDHDTVTTEGQNNPAFQLIISPPYPCFRTSDSEKGAMAVRFLAWLTLLCLEKVPLLD